MALKKFRPQGLLSFLADVMMFPVMCLLQGNFRESPQRTHRWNNYKIRDPLEKSIVASFPSIRLEGDSSASERWLGFLPLFHIPVLGGWRKYVVLKPVTYEGKWCVGWRVLDGVCGVSQIPVKGPVRVLIGPETVFFFGVTVSGEPVTIYIAGQGEIGDGGEFSQFPLH